MPTMRAKPKTPPTTPPAIAPTFDDLEEDEPVLDAGDVDEPDGDVLVVAAVKFWTFITSFKPASSKLGVRELRQISIAVGTVIILLTCSHRTSVSQEQESMCSD
jgi:hypothetical protein